MARSGVSVAAAGSIRYGRPAIRRRPCKMNRGPANRSLEHIQTKELIAVASAATTTVLTPAAAATARALFAGLGEVDRERATVNRLAVHPLDGLLRLLGSAHSDETEPARAASLTVHHQVGFSDRAEGGERILQVVFGGVKGKVSYEQFITHVILS